MRAIKPYPTYRHSGLPWLGPVPEHWDVRRNGRLFAQRNDIGHENLPILEVSLRTGVRVRDLSNGARKQMMTDRSKYKRAAKEDIAYNMMRMWQGAVGVAPTDGLISPAYIVAVPFPDVDPHYYSYLFRTAAYMREVDTFSRGIVSDRNRLYWGAFKQMPSAVPPIGDQLAIVNFLDAHGHLANRLIRNKRRLIALLNEQKQEILNEAVTRGLTPDAPIKQTRMDLMPEVPAHWEVRPLKHWVRINSAALREDTDPDYVFDYLDISCVGTGFLTAQPQRMRFATAPSRARRMVQKGDTVVSTVRTYLKAVFYISDDWPDLIASTGFSVLRPNGSVLPDLLGYILQSNAFVDQVTANSIGVAYPAISETKLAALHLSVSLDQKEQFAILSHIRRETRALDEAIDRTQREIALVREYRERVIDDVITGKLDVRGAKIAMLEKEVISDDNEYLSAEEEPEEVDAMEEADGEE